MTNPSGSSSTRGLVLRFALGFPLLAGAVLGFLSWTAPGESARESVADATAVASGTLFPLVGYDVKRTGRLIRAADGHGIRVGTECDAVPILVLFLAAVAVSPVRWTRRLAFGAAGAAILLLVNQARILHLLWVSDRDPDAFRAAHETWWPAALLLVGGGMFLLWAKRAGKDPV